MRKRTRAGRLRSVIEFQEPVDVADNAGGVSRTWTTVKTRRCEQLSQNHRLMSVLQQRHLSMTHAFTMRHTDVEPEWQIIYDNEPHRLIAIYPVGDKKEIRVITERENKTYGH